MNTLHDTQLTTARIAVGVVGGIICSLLFSWAYTFWVYPNFSHSVFFTHFRDMLFSVGLAYLATSLGVGLMPPHDRDVGPGDRISVVLASACVVTFVSSKWLGPVLDGFVPYAPTISGGKWTHPIRLLSFLILALAGPRFLNARISRHVGRSPTWRDKDTSAFAVMAWLLIATIWASIASTELGKPLPFIQDFPSGRVDITRYILITPVVLAITGIFFWFSSRPPPTRKDPIGRISQSTRNNYPVVAWSQIVGTSDTVASSDARGRFKLYVGVVVVAALAGLASGSLENGFYSALLAIWLGAFGLRGAGTLVMKGQSLGRAPHVKTEYERREELTPISRREDCEAFVEERNGKLLFCVARGTASEGPLPVVECVPFESFSNFEEGSHKQWFRPRGAVNETLDWGVIIAQSSVSGIVKVAESLHEQAWLIELLVKLQTTFIAPRDAMLQTLKEAEQKRRADDEPTGSSGAPIDATPVKPF